VIPVKRLQKLAPDTREVLCLVGHMGLKIRRGAGSDGCADRNGDEPDQPRRKAFAGKSSMGAEAGKAKKVVRKT